MSQGLTKQIASNQVATVPAPIGGINAYDSLAAMPETDAISMMNWFPQPYGCTVRRGSQAWVTGLGGEVKTLAKWSSTASVAKLFGWAVTSMFDCSTSGAVGAALVTGLTNAEWWWVNFGNIAGPWLLAVNGFDNAIIYGTGGVARLSLGDGITANTWKNLDPKNAVHVTVHQGRIWAVEKNSTFGWYLPTDVIYGILNRYDFGPFFPNGGNLDTLSTWTIDQGDGATDCLVAVSTNGDVVIYEGTDVESDSLWQLKGVYYIGAPIEGRRYTEKVAGDLYILTVTGVVSLATIFTSSQVSVSSETVYSKKIQNLLSDATSEVGDLPNWELRYFPGINQLYINIPTVTSEGSSQLLANTIINAWTVFTGYKASCFCNYLDLPFYGGPAGTVFKGWFGFLDEVAQDGSGGTTVRTSVQQAYSYLKAPAIQKQVGMYRPNFLVQAALTYSSLISYDFAVPNIIDPSGGAATAGSLWGVALWNQGRWFGGIFTQRDWSSAEGIGVAASLNMKTVSQADITWVSTDYTYKNGGIL